MNKEFLTVFFIATALLVGAIRYTSPLHEYFLDGLNGIKKVYWSAVESIDETIEEHFNQKETIKYLRKELAKYKEDRLLLQSIANRFNMLLADNQSRLKDHTHVQLARAISYAKFGDRNKVWLEMDDFNTSKIYGLVRNEKSAGIVVEKLGKPLALLNPDPKSAYAVYVGDAKAPGIARGKKRNEMVVEFIPTWMKIKVGDEVFTSGLDKLFFPGIAVGKVLSFKRSQGFQVATIKPYANTEQLGYFHVIEQE